MNIIPVSTTTAYSSGVFPEGTYEFSYLAVYEHGNYSNLRTFAGTVSATSGTVGTYSFETAVMIPAGLSGRVIGFHVFYRGTTVVEAEWKSLYYVRLKDGIVDDEFAKELTSANEGSWQKGALEIVGVSDVSGSNNTPIAFARKVVSIPTGETYESITGLSGDRDDIYFKTIEYFNGYAYAGNIRFSNKAYSDTILKSLPQRFNTFSFERRLELDINDGDEIIKLKSFSDKLFVFKRYSLYIIGISGGIEYVEAIMPGYGIPSRFAVTMTESGLLWFNEYGIFLHDGRQIVNLVYDIENQSRRKINWSYPKELTFFDFDGIDESNIRAQYFADENIAFVWKDFSANNGIAINFDNMTLSHVTESISYNTRVFVLNSKSVVISGRNLLYIDRKTSNLTGVFSYKVRFPEIDLGRPLNKKVLRSVKLRYFMHDNGTPTSEIYNDVNITVYTDAASKTTFIANSSGTVLQTIGTLNYRCKHAYVEIESPTARIPDVFDIHSVEYLFRQRDVR
jgi:hypothetical protein